MHTDGSFCVPLRSPKSTSCSCFASKSVDKHFTATCVQHEVVVVAQKHKTLVFFRHHPAGVCIPRLAPALGGLPVLASAEPASYWLTRSLFLRCLGGVFAVAFSVALRQNPALIGDQVGGERRVLHVYVTGLFFFFIGLFSLFSPTYTQGPYGLPVSNSDPNAEGSHGLTALRL